MLGKVQVNNLNQYQGPTRTIENYFLFIGRGAGVNEGKLLDLGNDTDLDAVLGSADSDLKTHISAARSNAGQNWTACVIPLAAGATWADAVDFAMERVSVEGIFLVDPVTAATGVENMQTKAEDIMGKYMRPVFFAGRTRPREGSETWPDFQDAIRPLTANVAADQVSMVATLWGPELGAYAGRLANRSVTVADSPMRVATGPLVGNWAERPEDTGGNVLSLAILKAIDAMRISVPQWYPDYEGTYWADGNVLDVNGGDYQVIENVRVTHKVMRRIYPIAVSMIGNRQLNQTPTSIAWAQGKMMRPLRMMAKSRTVNGVVFPGEIMEPKDGDVKIVWLSKYEVEIWFTITPHNSPKSITCNILLDLSNYE